MRWRALRAVSRAAMAAAGSLAKATRLRISPRMVAISANPEAGVVEDGLRGRCCGGSVDITAGWSGAPWSGALWTVGAESVGAEAGAPWAVGAEIGVATESGPGAELAAAAKLGTS